MKHLIEGNSCRIQLKAKHAKFRNRPRPMGGGSETVGTDWTPPVMEGWAARRY